MVLLGDEAQVDARFWSVCRYYKSLPNIGAQFAPNIPQAQKIVLDALDGTPRWRVSSGTMFSVRLEIVLIMTQDRCTVCAERTIGSKIILDAPDGTPSWRGSSGNSFSVRLEIVLIMTQDRCKVCTERNIGSEIILDANNGTPRWRGHVESRFRTFGDDVSVGAR